MSLVDLSKRQQDLLAEDVTPKSFHTSPAGETAEKSDFEAPKNLARAIPHELLAEGSRMTTNVASLINARRLLAGNGQAEQMLLELNTASQINRGPDGVFESSRLHWDMLLGRDSMIYPSDYLNFDAKMKL